LHPDNEEFKFLWVYIYYENNIKSERYDSKNCIG